MAEPVRHRQTKGAATDMFDLQPPRHTSTLHISAHRLGAPTVREGSKSRRLWGLDGGIPITEGTEAIGGREGIHRLPNREP